MRSLLLLGASLLTSTAVLGQQPPPSTLNPAAAQGTDLTQQPGIPVGTLSPKLTIISRIYDGMASDYWVYVPAQYDPKTAAPLMVFQDGEGYTNRAGDHPALNVLDNLIAAKKIPPLIAVFINPGDISSRPGTPTYALVEKSANELGRTVKDSMRSVEYDTVSDRYARFLRDELLPSVYSKYNIRRDSYSRAITGLSSGGICAFNTAWQQPDQFSRVISWIGSFTDIQWRQYPYIPDGGQDYPDKILHEAHRNLRVWLQDGSNDMENVKFGSWPLANLRMANALKLKDYDFRLSFGSGSHSAADGGAEFPEELVWLWRGYDPAQTSQTYTQDPAEKMKPPFRVSVTNREP